MKGENENLGKNLKDNLNNKMDLKVIGAGQGRTGTLSLKQALEILGYGKCYHMVEVIQNNHTSQWVEIFQNKHRDWDKIFKGYSSTVDAPSNFFWEELLEANPNAKVILTVRDPEAWYQSCRETIFFHMVPSFQPFGYKIFKYFVPFSKRFALLTKEMRNQWPKDENSKEDFVEYFNNYVENVKNKCPSDKLLVFNVKEGWEPLCKFLNVPIPKQDFPRVNDMASFKRMNKAMEVAGYAILGLLVGAVSGISYFGYHFIKKK